LRQDDAPETVVKRLATYREQTAPLIEFYDKKGKLRKVAGQEDVEDTKRLVFEAVK
jgi:adenylate kinase